MRLAVRLEGYVLLLALSACVSDPVEWSDVSYRLSQLGDPDTRSAVFSANLPVPDGWPSNCLRSIRTARTAPDFYRIWWSARRDSSVALWVQRSGDNGKSWDKASSIDTRDRGRRGCDRPAPGIFLDRISGYLHIVYFVEAADGAGVFFAHSMDKGATFHSPVAVVYGNRPSAAAVAANGDSVVVVFEDPNATAPRIGIVLSHTTGHIFETRAQVTPDDVPAAAPWVALDHRTITVWWKDPSASDSEARERVGYRVGTWR